MRRSGAVSSESAKTGGAESGLTSTAGGMVLPPPEPDEPAPPLVVPPPSTAVGPLPPGAIVMIEEDGDAAVRRADEFAASRGLSEQARANIVAGDPDTVRRQVKRFEDAGVDTFSVGVPNGVTVKDVDLFGRSVLASW